MTDSDNLNKNIHGVPDWRYVETGLDAAVATAIERWARIRETREQKNSGQLEAPRG